MVRRDIGLPARGALAAVALAAGAVAGGAITARTARRMSAPPHPRSTPVVGVDEAAGEIRFAATPDSLLPGRYSFWFAGGRGHARVGEVVGREGGVVVRRLLGVDAGDVAAATEGRFNGWMHLSPAQLGVPFRDERVQTTQGVVPAWVIPGGDGTRWAVLVHGRASVRQEALRAVPAFLAAGHSVLLPAYRGDGEAPDGEQHRYAVTDAEWVDVESAVLFALDAGATEVVLAGWSSGASIVLATAHRSRLRTVLSGIVLDSPVLDGAQALLARGGGVPAPVRHGALSLLSGRWGALVGAGRLDVDPAQRADPAELTVPVLVLHSEDDGVAAIDAARRFAAVRPDLVRLVEFTGARHTRLWNLDPDRWEAAVTGWLRGDAGERVSAEPTSARRADRSRRAVARAAPPRSDRPGR